MCIFPLFLLLFSFAVMKKPSTFAIAKPHRPGNVASDMEWGANINMIENYQFSDSEKITVAEYRVQSVETNSEGHSVKCTPTKKYLSEGNLTLDLPLDGFLPQVGTKVSVVSESYHGGGTTWRCMHFFHECDDVNPNNECAYDKI